MKRINNEPREQNKKQEKVRVTFKKKLKKDEKKGKERAGGGRPVQGRGTQTELLKKAERAPLTIRI